MPDIATIDKEVTDDMRRFRSIQWVDPKKAKGGPTLTVRGAMQRLGFSSEKSIYIYTRRGPERGGLPGYIPSDDGQSWIRRSGPSNGKDIMFYEQDVKAWAETHPDSNASTPKHERVNYTDAERDFVLDMAKLAASPAGVYRTHLATLLRTIDYVNVHFADGRPDATGWLIPGSQETATLYVARGDHRTIVVPAVDITVIAPPGIKDPTPEKGKGKTYWNARAYPKLKQILDDANIVIPPLPPSWRKKDQAS
jgi:hypothetical protein